MFVFQNFFLTGKLRINYLSQEPHTYLNSVFTECAALYWWQVRKSDEEDKQLAHTATDAPNIMHSQHLNFRASSGGYRGGRGCTPLFGRPPFAPCKWGGRGDTAPLNLPLMMATSPRFNATITFWKWKKRSASGGLRPQTPTGAVPLDPELNFTE